MIDTILGELSRAVRTFIRRPAFGGAAVMVLALGIAAVSTMFSTLHGVVLRPLPFRNPDRLVWIYSSSKASPRNSTSALDYFDYRSRFKGFESLAACLVFTPTTYLSGDGDPEPLESTRVSHNFFSTLGVMPAIGRAFLPADEDAGSANVVIVSHELWQRRLNGAPSVVGRHLTLDDAAYEVVGVMPAGFAFPSRLDAWFPMRPGEAMTSGRGNNNFSMFGRLRPGGDISAAQAEGDVLAKGIAEAYPADKTGWGLLLVPMHEVFFAEYRPAMILLLGAVLLLLLVTCANVSSLFLARVVGRQGELTVRSALGASRPRVAWHVLAESLVLSAAGGGAGLALTWAGIRGVRALAPAGIPRVSEIAIDARVALFTTAVCMLAGLLTGLVPALRGWKTDGVQTLRREARGADSRSSTFFQSILVVGEIALTLVLLVGSGLFVKSLERLYSTDVGFSASSLLLADVRPPASMSDDVVRQSEFYRQLGERLKVTPGVAGVALGEQMPFLPGGRWNYVLAGDRPAPPPEARVRALRLRVSDGYFRTLGMKILRGRAIAATDTRDRAPVAVVNEALAERMWPGEAAVGKTLILPWNPEVRMDVVGVAANVKESGPASDPRPTFYASLAQLPAAEIEIAVRTTGDPLAVVSLVRQAASSVDPSVAVSAFQTMESRFVERTAARGSARRCSGHSPCSRSSWPPRACSACSRTSSPSARTRSASGLPSARVLPRWSGWSRGAAHGWPASASSPGWAERSR